MAPAVVYLHIGSPKTGSTYLQDSLWDNREALAADGVLLPGRSRAIVGKWIGDLLKWKPSHGDLPSGWVRLTDEVNAWEGRSAVISSEHLHKANQAQWDALVESFPGARIEVVLTARDLARSVPAQWQSSVRQRFTWTLGEYADAVAGVSDPGLTSEAAGHFWRRQNSPRILRRYLDRLPHEQVRLVTVPPSGGDPDELWRRFCRACDLDVSRTRPGSVSHESLGAASAEVMRRLNAAEPVGDLPMIDYKRTINHALSRHSLSLRRGEEAGLTLPPQHRAWAEARAEELIQELVELGVEVVGDLEDLRPRATTKPFVSPEGLPAEELLEAALAGLTGMAMQHVELRAQLDAATAEAAAAALEARSVAAEARAEARLREEQDRVRGMARVLRRLQRDS